MNVHLYLCTGSSTSHPEIDHIHVYVCELLTFGLIWMNYYDAIKEGDDSE